jgi:K+-sensing histidine kinase KdpD
MPSKKSEFDTSSETALIDDVYGRIFGTLSHDLKTPLATMIGSLEVIELLGDKLSPLRQSELIAAALSEARRLDRFISNHFDLSRLEQGGIKLKLTEINITQLVDEAIFRLGALSNRGTIEVLVQSDVFANSDSALLSRVVELIIDNAFRHTGSNPHVRVKISQDDDLNTLIRVCDQGEGIAENLREHIFTKYERIKSGDSKSVGAGLGLTLSRHIMNLLGGTITVGDNDKLGAVFTIKLPPHIPKANV